MEIHPRKDDDPPQNFIKVPGEDESNIRGDVEVDESLVPCALPKDFDIEEVEVLVEDDQDDVVDGGLVGTWSKGEGRVLITGIAIAVWVVCTLASLIRALVTGDPTLLVAV